MVSLTDKPACRNRQSAAEASWFPGLQRLRDVTKWWSNGQPARPWLEHYPEGVPTELAYPQQRLGWLLRPAAERFPRRIACHYYGEQVTYEELLTQAHGLAALCVSGGQGVAVWVERIWEVCG